MAKITKRDVLTKAMGMDFTQVANEAVKAEIAKVLTAEPKTAKAIADAVGESTNKVAALLKQIEGVVVTEGKGKNPKTYSIAE